MNIKTSYVGELNGIKGIWCGEKPEGLIVEKEVPVYWADEGKVFTKDGEFFPNVVLQEGEKIEDYVEIVAPKEEKEEKYANQKH